MLEKNLRVALLAFGSFVLPEKAMKQQRQTAAGAANDDFQVRVAIENAARYHARDTLRYLGIREHGVGDAGAIVFSAPKRGVLGRTGAVEKDRPAKLGYFPVNWINLRPIHDHLA